MSSIIDITNDESFKSHISSLEPGSIVAISFHTPWAAPCKQMRLILETLASSYPLRPPQIISFLSVDAEALPDISEAYDVSAVPLLILERDGKVLESVSGSDAVKVRDAIERHAGKGGNTGTISLPPALDTTPRQNVTAEQQLSKSLNGHASSTGDNVIAPVMSARQESQEELEKRLAELVKAAPVMLFMKGAPSSPQCGFSKQLVGLLRKRGVRYGFFNILADEDVRQGLKVWSDWPTFPQLYLRGELLGGLDIVKEEIENNPELFAEFQAAPKGDIDKAASELQKEPVSA